MNILFQWDKIQEKFFEVNARDTDKASIKYRSQML